MPKQRNYARELRQNLEALVRIAPSQYMSEAMLSPLYTGLQLENTDALLNGTDAQNFTYYDWIKPVYQQPNGRRTGGGGSMFPGFGGGFGMPGLPGMGDGGGGGFNLPGLKGGFDMPGLPGFPGGDDKGGFGLPGLGGLFGGDDDKPKRKLITPGHWQPNTSSRPAQRGLLSIYEQDVTPALARMQSATREADIADVLKLGPAARLAIRSANPENARLLDLMNEQATGELGMGASLDPALRRVVAQTIRGRQSGTMLSNGDAGAYDEALGMSMFGQQLRNDRRGFAGNVVGLNQSVHGDPFQAALGRSSGMVPAAFNAGGQASGISSMLGPRLIDPQNGYAQDLRDSNANALWASDITKQNNRAALTAAGISAAGSLLGGAAGMI